MIAAILAAVGCAICFYGPDNMVFDRAGSIYITDTNGKQQSRLIKLSTGGKVLAQWHVFAQGTGDRSGPEGIALAANGTILVTDAGSEHILKVSHKGEVLGTFGGDAGGFTDLGHVAVDKTGRVYVSQAKPNTIEEFAANGALIATWRRQRGARASQWGGPETIATEPDGSLVVEDWRNRRIEILDSLGNTIAAFGRSGRRPGEFLNTAGLGTDGNGNIYVADIKLHRVQEFDPHGKLLRIIANTSKSRLFEAGPSAVAIDQDGNLYSPDGLSLVKYTQKGALLARWR